MVALWIILGIILLFVIVFWSSVSVSASYDIELKVKVKYAFLTLYELPVDKQKALKKKQKLKRKAYKKQKKEAAKRKRAARKNTTDSMTVQNGIQDTVKQPTADTDNTQNAKVAKQTKNEPFGSKVKNEAEKQQGVAEKNTTDSMPIQNDTQDTVKQPSADTDNAQNADTAEKSKNEPYGSKVKKEKPSIDFEMIKELIATASPPIKRLFKKIRFGDIYIDVLVGGEDAAAVALNYGKTNMVINGLMCWLEHIATLRIEKILIKADFDKEKSTYSGRFTLKLRLGTAVACAIWFLARYFKLIISKK